MRLFKLVMTGICCIWLASCSTISPQKNAPPANQPQSWDDRVQTLSDIQTWDLKGLIAIRNSTKHDDLTANLQWHQSHQDYQLLLFGPLGAGGITLKGSPTLVTLQTANGQTFHAASPEILLAQQTNWQLPVSNLFYWVRGLPVPNMPAQKQFDAFHHLTLLQQQGWQIQYLSYISLNRIDVPNKIILTNPDFFVKIIIKQWLF